MSAFSTSKVIGIDGYRNATKGDQEPIDVTSLALKLQQTLEIAPLLQTFCDELAFAIPCDSVSYRNAHTSFKYHTGEIRAHRCRYQLELESDYLGHIECSRAKPFTMKETDLIERLLSLLIYPLRNALLYQKAVDDSYRDPLTQIGNRAAFNESLNREICAFKRHLSSFSLIVIDIDHFKQVNDTYGHIAGDSVLQAVAKEIRNTLRRSDEVFRYGGEEFVVILSNTDLDGAKFIADRIRKVISKMSVEGHPGIKVTASFGVSATNVIRDVNDTLYHADKALYQAKEEGRNRVVVRP